MPKLWFLSGIGSSRMLLLEIPPDVKGLKDWVDSKFSVRPGWPDEISTRYSPDGAIDLSLTLNFRLCEVSEVEALQAMSKAEMDKH
jgi:hypothetical protein